MKTSSKILMGVTGALLVALGIICICNPDATLLSASLLIGIFTLASGISTIVTWAKLKYFLPTGNLLLSGILQVILGLIFLNHNMFLAATLPVIFACWLIAEGIILSIRAFDFKKVYFRSWWVILILGIATAVLGILALKDPYEFAGPALSYLIGSGIILLGVMEIIALCEINKIEKCGYRWLAELQSPTNTTTEE